MRARSPACTARRSIVAIRARATARRRDRAAQARPVPGVLPASLPDCSCGRPRHELAAMCGELAQRRDFGMQASPGQAGRAGKASHGASNASSSSALAALPRESGGPPSASSVVGRRVVNVELAARTAPVAGASAAPPPAWRARSSASFDRSRRANAAIAVHRIAEYPQRVVEARRTNAERGSAGRPARSSPGRKVSRWPARLPLSTDDTYSGGSGFSDCVSYQL